MQFNIIGAGRLGKNIAFALIQAKIGQLKAICNKSIGSAELAIEEIGSGVAVSHLHALAAVDLTFITSTDDAIPLLVNQLAQQKTIAAGSIVVHCSGVLSSSELKALQAQGCLIASLHPLKAFRAGSLDKDTFKDCDCVVEGDEAALIVLSSLFKQLGARLIPIRAASKASYHAAAVIASNYLVTLAATASELLEKIDIDAEIARQMILRLMSSSLNNLQQTAKVADALTGPLARGDLNTIAKHLQALDDLTIKSFYRAAALATLPITNLNEELKASIRALCLENNT